MRSIQARFNRERQRQPNLGAYIQYAEAIKGQNFTKRALAQSFYKLVPRSEYCGASRKELIKHLMELTKK